MDVMMCCKSVGTDLSMLDIDDFMTEISQLKKEVALLETKLRLRGDEGLKREDVDVVCCESSTQDSELSLPLLCYTESKPTDTQDTTVCDSNQDLQDDESTDQTSTESLDSVCNAGEQQQILQNESKTCSVKLIDCTNVMMEIKTEPTEIKTEPIEEEYEYEDNHDDGHNFILSDVKSELCLDGEITSSTLSCITGGETLSSQSHLERNERKHTKHEHHLKKHTNERPYQCSKCGIIFKKLCSLKSHQKIHSEEKRYQCSQCDKHFTQKSNLIVHQRIHTGEKPHHCSVCGRSFNQREHLLSHQRTHTGERPYKCSHCEKTFTQLSNLYVHERIHTGEKPYLCRICGKSFIQRGHLVSHQKTHKGEKPYKCSECEIIFDHLASFKAHQRIHTGEKTHHCNVCGRSFRQQVSFLKHQRTHTGEK